MSSPIFQRHPEFKKSLLRDIRTVFIDLNLDIIPNEILWYSIMNLKNSEVNWTKYHLTKHKISQVLMEYEIKNIIYRFLGGEPTRCWFKQDFKEVWQRLLD
jgi:hypothetical protein